MSVELNKDKEILTLEEAAELLEISPRSLREAAARGEIPARKIARQWRFSRFALHRWLSGEPENPYLRHAGALADNPLWGDVQEAIATGHHNKESTSRRARRIPPRAPRSAPGAARRGPDHR